MQVIITSDIAFTIDTEDPDMAKEIALQKLYTVDGIIDMHHIEVIE